MSDAKEELLKQCGGITWKTSATSWRSTNGRDREYVPEFYKVGEITVPDGVYIKINHTATKGTVGKLVGIEANTYGELYAGSKSENQIISYEITYLYECEGRKQTGRINSGYTTILPGIHQTEYVRNVNNKPKEIIKNPVNKFKQEMKEGDWVVGVKKDKTLGIGRITRWTKSNVWAVMGEDLTDKSKEFMFRSIQETFTMPNDEHVQLLTMAVLKGWDGR